jgi:hypothetical protein
MTKIKPYLCKLMMMMMMMKMEISETTSILTVNRKEFQGDFRPEFSMYFSFPYLCRRGATFSHEEFAK